MKSTEITQRQAKEFMDNTVEYNNGRGMVGWEITGTGTKAVLSFPWYKQEETATAGLIAKFIPSTLPPLKEVSNGWFCGCCYRGYTGGPKDRLDAPRCPNCSCTLQQMKSTISI